MRIFKSSSTLAGHPLGMSGPCLTDQLPLKFAPISGLVAAPVFAKTTCAVEPSVPDDGGTYCTTIVQLPPGLITEPDPQVPPVIEKTPVPAVLTTVGAAVRVSGPVAAAALLTVMVPVFVVVLAVPVVNAGDGAEIVTLAPVTVKLTLFVLPPVAFGVET